MKKCRCGKIATTKVTGLIYEFTHYVCDDHLKEYKNSDPYEKFVFTKIKGFDAMLGYWILGQSKMNAK